MRHLQFLVTDGIQIQQDHSYWSIIILELLIHEHTFIAIIASTQG